MAQFLLSARRSVFFIPLFYLFLGLVWIKFSDDFVFSLTKHLQADDILLISKQKGFFYVVVTSILLFYLIRISTRRLVSVKRDFERLFEKHPKPMWIYDLETSNILLVNEAACREYGYTREEFLTLSLYDLRPKSEHERLKENLRNNTSEGYSNSGEWLHKNKGGETFYVNIFSHDTLYGGRKCRIVTTINIHQLTMLQLHKNNIQSAIDNATLVSITDTNGVILEVNDKFCQVSQWAREELLGRTHAALNSDHHDVPFWQNMWQTILAGKTWKCDVKNRAKDGSFYWLDTVITPLLDRDGRIYRFMEISYVITERKQLEQRMCRKNEQLEEIAWIHSHKVRGPTATILGLCQLLAQEGITFDEREQYIALLHKSAMRLDEMIHKIVENSSEIA